MEMSFNEVVLERLKVAARAQLSPQVAHDLDVQTAVDVMTDNMIVQISTYVMAEKINVDDVTVPFSKTVTPPKVDVAFDVAPPDRWVSVVPHAAGVIVCALLAVLERSPVFVGAAACFIVLAAVLWLANTPQRQTVSFQPEDVDVRGDVTIERTLWAKLPENTRVYPKEMGRAVKYAELGQPSFFFGERPKPEVDWIVRPSWDEGDDYPTAEGTPFVVRARTLDEAERKARAVDDSAHYLDIDQAYTPEEALQYIGTIGDTDTGYVAKRVSDVLRRTIVDGKPVER